MYKNMTAEETVKIAKSFNPCFNGSMYKNADEIYSYRSIYRSFNPCFNGSMYKNIFRKSNVWIHYQVSILVLMDLCIKTLWW